MNFAAIPLSTGDSADKIVITGIERHLPANFDRILRLANGQVLTFLLSKFRILSNWKDEYPFDSHFFSREGAKLHYIDEGPRDSKQTIVCVHGNPTWSFYYRRILQRFRSDYRALAIDHVGCGLSDKPQEYDYCLAQHTRNLIAWLDALDLRDVLLAVHDWGGAIGLGAAVERPDRIAKLMILNTAAFPPPYVPLRIAACRIPWLGSFAVRQWNLFAGAAVWMAIHRLKKLSNEARQGLLYPYRRPADRIAIDRFVRDIPLTRRHRTYSVLENLERRLSTLADKPTRLVWGMKDWCFRPECLDRLQKHFPRAGVRRLGDVGHYVMEEAPDEVIDEMAGLLNDRRSDLR